jgi:hypothetical protein
MKRKYSLRAGLVLAATVCLGAGILPAAQAQTSCQVSGGPACSVHFVGAGASAQLVTSAIAADQAAINANAALYGGSNTIKHWSKKYKSSTNDGAYLSDDRSSAIVNQTGNVWVVWIENASGSVTDIWTFVSVDPAVGIRCVLAQQTNGAGCQTQITSAAGVASDGLIASNFWPDHLADVAIDLPALNAINTSLGGGQHVNVGLSDNRPEDVLAATNRLICTTRNATLTCLGDELVKNVGNEIVTAQGTGSFAQPVAFSLPGEKDPFTEKVVPSTFTTYPIGAAPIVFIANNNGTPLPTNLISGVTPDLHVTGQVYPLANLFDGSGDCGTGALAFGGSGSGGTPLTLFLREPTAGAMATTEFSLFRSDGNSNDSQELNMDLGAPGTGPCASGGSRERAISTSEVVGSTSPAYGVLGIPNSLGYTFGSWSNFAKFKGSSNYQYLTLDNVDPIFAAPTAYNVCVGGSTAGQVCGTSEPCGGGGVCTPGGSTNQTIPYCNAAVCTTDLWPAYTDSWTGYTFPAGVSYPNLRYGLYKVWSVYRWIAEPTDDPYGPSAISQEAQNYADGDVADFVPFAACAPGTGNSCLTSTGPTDGLAVFRAHFTDTGVKATCVLSNGSVTSANLLDTGNTLGGGTECGGDVGGLIFGPFGTDSPSVSYVTWTATATKNKGYKLTYKNGDKFTTSSPATGSNVTLVCDDATGAQNVVETSVELNSAGTVYVSEPNPDTSKTIACRLVAGNIAHAAATSTEDGTTYEKKHQ